MISSSARMFLMHKLKITDDYWRLISVCGAFSSPECEQFLDLMANTSRWRGEEMPDKIDTVRLKQSVTLLAIQEHLVWGKLPVGTPMSPGSTLVVEPTSSKSMPRNIMVGRLLTHMWGDRWVPMKVTNLSDRPVTLKRNCKLADVFPCLAVEDFELFQGSSQIDNAVPGKHPAAASLSDLEQRLRDVGLESLDLRLSHTNGTGKEDLVQLLERHNDVFSKHDMDCG